MATKKPTPKRKSPSVGDMLLFHMTASDVCPALVTSVRPQTQAPGEVQLHLTLFRDGGNITTAVATKGERPGPEGEPPEADLAAAAAAQSRPRTKDMPEQIVTPGMVLDDWARGYWSWRD